MIEHLTIQNRGLKSAMLAIGAAFNAIPGQYYLATNTNEYFYGAQDGSLIGPLLTAATEYISSHTDTATVDLGVAAGVLTANVKLSAVAGQHLTAQADGIHAKALTIHSGSTSYMEIDGSYQLKVKQLLITDNTVDATNSTLSAHLTAVGYNAGNLIYQESDIIILTTSHQTWIQNGGTAGTTADFTAISADVTDSYIRNLFSGVSGVDYNPGTGVFSLNQSYTRGLFSGTGLITYTSGTGVITLADSTVRALFSGTAPVSYNSTTGAFTLAANGVTDSFFRQSAALSIVGNGTNATANVADIQAGTDHFVLRRSGTAVAFGLLALNSISATNNQVFFGSGGIAAQSANFTFNGTNVGIGNPSSLSHKLRVNGSVQIGDAFSYTPPAQGDLAVGSNSGNSRILFGQDNSFYGGMQWNYNATPANAYLSVGLMNAIPANGLNIQQNGQVSIGSITPSTGALLFVNGIINSATGYRIANAATSGQYLRGNSTNFVSSALLASDLSGAVAVVNGGTGLSALGTALQQLRVNAGATAIEWFTPAATSYTFNNGLTEASGVVKFGGTLTQHTTLAIADFNHFVTRGTGKVTYFSGTAGPSAFNIYNQDLEIISVTPWSALNGIILYDDSGNRRRVTLKGSRLLVSDPL